jgi:predicted ATPase/class 3 adenylate cyclase
MPAAPEGTLTLLFTDIEGSTRLLARISERYADLLAAHHRLLRGVFVAHGGYEVETAGDAFFVAFASAKEAVAAAAEAQQALAAHDWPDRERIWVRMGLHTGEPRLIDGSYVGLDVHHAARVMAAGHGGQVLLSQTTRDLLAQDITLHDLGEHRLKDLSLPQRLYQLQVEGLPSEFPPLKSLHQTNLPVQPTPLIGRERELAEVLAYLRGGTRLLTLTGPGGTGKTRLALHAAAEMADDYPDGVWFVPLAPIADPALLEATVAQVLGLRGELGEELQGKRLLLVLDNLEQILDAAPAVGALLADAPQVSALVTSRERLALAAEQEYHVPGLERSEAVALFIARARQLQPRFVGDEHVDGIVARLDGLPLALELAAARVKLLTSAQIEDRLTRSLDLLTGGSRDAPQRQRTLRATIEWSHNLLDQPERDLLADLAVFAGSFPLEAAEMICEADLDTLQSLLDKSLLRATEDGRFFLLETIRAYAAERLAERPDADDLRRRHADYTIELIGDSYYFDAERVDLLDGWSAEIAAAVRWTHAEGEHTREIQLLSRSDKYWMIRGLTREARHWVEEAIAHAPPDLDAAERVRALTALCTQCTAHGDMARAQSASLEALDYSRKTDNHELLLKSLNTAGHMSTASGDYESAQTLLREAVSMARSLNSIHLEASLVNHGLVLLYTGQLEDADAAMRESQAIFQQQNNSEGAANVAFNLGLVALKDARYGDARRYFLDTLHIAARLKFGHAAMYAHEGLAALHAQTGESTRAAELLGAADQLRDQTGAALEAFEQAIHDETLRNVEQRLDTAELAAAFDRGREAVRDDITASTLTCEL